MCGVNDVSLPQVDPYAPDVTPAQMKKLTEDEKKKVAAFSEKLKKMNPGAYGNFTNTSPEKSLNRARKKQLEKLLQQHF